MAYLEIRDSDILHNIGVIRERAGVPVWGVLKYDGYGLGLVHMAALLREGGIRLFAVGNAQEAHLLRQSGFTQETILLLQPESTEEGLRLALADGAVLSAGSAEYVRRILAVSGASLSRPRLHIAVDTGLGRFGFLPSEYGKILSVYRNPVLSVEGIYTHFACASGSRYRTKKQFRLFASLLSSLSADGVDRGMAHAAASTALFRYENMRLDAVRTGSALTGRAGSLPPSETGLVRAGTLVADVCDVRSLPRGSRLGYGGEARLHRPSEIAVLSCGRQAGLLPPPLLARLRGRYGTVHIDGRPFPVLSSRSAGYLLADVTGAGIRPGALVRADVNPLFVDGRIRRVYL